MIWVCVDCRTFGLRDPEPDHSSAAVVSECQRSRHPLVGVLGSIVSVEVGMDCNRSLSIAMRCCMQDF